MRAYKVRLRSGRWGHFLQEVLWRLDDDELLLFIAALRTPCVRTVTWTIKRFFLMFFTSFLFWNTPN